MNIPEIRIQAGSLLYKHVSPLLLKKYGSIDDTLPSEAALDDVAETFRQAWQPVGESIVESMCTATGLAFQKNIIPVYIVPWMWPISDPLVMHTDFEPDEFVDELTHELLHNLLADNTSGANTEHVLDQWREVFGEQEHDTLIHIAIHAVQKLIYLETMKDPGRLERDLQTSGAADNPTYKKAWDYVEAHDYKQIISQVAASYRK